MRKLLLFLVVACGGLVPLFALSMSPTERAESISYILKDKWPENVAEARMRCVAGTAQKTTDWSRSLGSDLRVDAIDECPATLLRQARDGVLLSLYRNLLVDLAGRAAGHEQLPAAIAGAVMKGGKQVDIGNQRAMTISAALALDAGFTVAFQTRAALASGMPALAALRPIADRCLRQQEADLSLCYVTGYTLGARAVSGQPVT